MKEISGGICASKGFKAAGVHCGIRKNKTKRDLALIVSDVPCSVAAVYTTNLVKGAPILVTKQNIADGKARAVIANSGNANTCNADGIEVAEKMCELAGNALGIDSKDVVVASTGVIGQKLDITPIKDSMGELVSSLSEDGSSNAAEAIMTTDTVRKEIAFEFEAGGKTCHIGGIAKGSGMIHPNMATLLVFVTTDCAISPEMLKKALHEDVSDSFNMLSVDGDTSTNDTLAVLANGEAGNKTIDSEGPDLDSFKEALAAVTKGLCRMCAKDGEGATKLLVCNVSGASDTAVAKTVAKSVICSNLLKCAMFGCDANWGRILCAIGYSGAQVDVTKIDTELTSKAGTVKVCKNGSGIDFSEDEAKKVLSEDEITIEVSLNAGTACATAWGCDLSYDYVKINGDYRT